MFRILQMLFAQKRTGTSAKESHQKSHSRTHKALLNFDRFIKAVKAHEVWLSLHLKIMRVEKEDVQNFSMKF